MEKCEFTMNDLKTHANLNILPSGSYDLLIGMDQLEKYRFILNYYDKTISCLDDKGNTIAVKGILRKVTIREISALQMKISVPKDAMFLLFMQWMTKIKIINLKYKTCQF